MTQTAPLNRSSRSRRRARRWSLLVLAGLPLLVLHVGLLVERAMHLESLDPVIVLRWVLSVALLVVLKRGAAGTRRFKSPTLGIAAVLIFALIHMPVIAPEPALPLAAAGLGLAMCLAIVDRRRGNSSAHPAMIYLAQPFSSAWSPFVSREALKDRAPPIDR